MSDLLFVAAAIGIISGAYALGQLLFGSWLDGPTVGRRK